MSQLFTSGGQSIGASDSALVLFYSPLSPSPRGSFCHEGGVCIADVFDQINKKGDNIIVTFSLYRILTRTFASKEGYAEASGHMHLKGVQFLPVWASATLLRCS